MSELTRLATITDRDVTRFVDTTAGPSRTFTYWVVLGASGGVSAPRFVPLPATGRVRVTLRPAAADGESTQITMVDGEVSCANYGASPTMSVGPNASTVSRGLQGFDLTVVPPGSAVTSAVLTMKYTATAAPVERQIALHPATARWEEGSGQATCAADGATWHDRVGGGLRWGVDGGDHDPQVVASGAVPAGRTSGTHTFDVRGWVQDIADGSRVGHGLLRAAAEDLAAGMAVNYRTDDDALKANRPQLVMEYADGNRAIVPTVELFADGSRITGQSLVTAVATDDRRVERVEFYLGETLLHTDIEAPYEFLWNSSTATSPTPRSSSGETGTWSR